MVHLHEFSLSCCVSFSGGSRRRGRNPRNGGSSQRSVAGIFSAANSKRRCLEPDATEEEKEEEASEPSEKRQKNSISLKDNEENKAQRLGNAYLF